MYSNCTRYYQTRADDRTQDAQAKRKMKQQKSFMEKFKIST